MNRRYFNTKKNNKRALHKIDTLSLKQSRCLSFKSLSEALPLITALIPIITSILYAVMFAHDFGKCTFFTISLNGYVGLSHSSLLTQCILIIGIVMGLFSLNIIAYMAFMLKKFYSIFLLIVLPLVIAAFSAAVFVGKYFSLIFKSMLPVFWLVCFVSFSFGTVMAFSDTKDKNFTQKDKFSYALKSNTLFKYFLILPALLLFLFFFVFISSYLECFKIEKLPFIEIDEREYAVIYESSDYYQLAYTEKYLNSEAKEKQTNNPKTLNIFLNSQMRVKKDNLLTIEKMYQ